MSVNANLYSNDTWLPNALEERSFLSFFFKIKDDISVGSLWLNPLIPTLARQRQEDLCEFEAKAQ